MLDKTADTLHRAHAAGVTMVVGTDTGFATTPYGEWHARELELLMTYAGLSATEAIRAATVNAAPMFNLVGQIGEIRAGCFADIIVVAGDPTKDIRVLQDPANIQVVMKGGIAIGFDNDRPISSWPHERSRVQSTAELTRAVVHDGEGAVTDNLPWAEEEARDLFADLTRTGRAAQAATADEAAAVAPPD
jgi:adenine deaminase